MTARTTTRPAATRTATKDVASAAPSIDKINAATADIKSSARVVRRSDEPHTAFNSEPIDAIRAKLKATVAEELHTPDDEQNNSEASYFDQMSAMFETFKIPSGRRMLVSVVMNFLTAGVTMYAGFSLTGMLLMGAAVLTSSAFIGFMISFMGFALSLYAGIILGAKVGKYIALGQIDDDAARVRSWISNKWNGLKDRMSPDAELSHV